MSRSTIEAFSISHAAILPGDINAFAGIKDATTQTTEYTKGDRASNKSVNTVKGLRNNYATKDLNPEIDLYGVKEATLEADIGEFDNEGDDRVLSVWYWLNYANISVTQGYVPFEQLAKITGDAENPVTSDVKVGDLETTSVTQINTPLWSQSSLNQPTVPLLLRLPAKGTNTETRNLYIILYKVQFKPLSFDGPSYKEGLMLNYEGKALVSDVDEAGQSLGGADAVGRLVITGAGSPLPTS